jgi:CRISPR-associated protein Cas1
MAAQVRSGDPNNLEAQAARRYWPLIFGNPRFRRGGDAEDQNRHLDYGYAVLRAAASRALCTAGLHPSISVRHHNRYNPFSLAADLMEPFRPLVDRRVFQWIARHAPAGPFDREVRAWMLGLLHERYEMEGEERTLFGVLARTANALARSVCGEDRAFAPPDGLRPCGG